MSKRFVFGAWNGGTCYGSPDLANDLERFPTISAAETAFRDRYRFGHNYSQIFNYVGRPSQTFLCPTVDDASYLDVFVVQAHTEREAISAVLAGEVPGRRMEIDVRGGLSVAR